MVKVTKVAKEFEAAIARVASVAGKEATPALAKFAREAAVKTRFTAKEAADALFFLASAGLKVKDMSKVLTPALNLATAANLEVAEATDLVVGQLKTYQKDMSKAADFVDILTKTNQLANTDVRQLGEALKFVSPIASGLGISFEDLNVVIAAMADIGIKGGLAGTQLRMAFAKLIKPTGEAKAVLEKYNITQEAINENLDDPIKLFELLEPATKNAADATAIFGVRQQGVIAVIRDQIPRLKELREGMKDYGGAAKNAADIQLDTLEGQMKLLNSAFQEVVLSLSGGTGLIPTIKELVKNTTVITNKFGKFIKSAKGIRIINGLLAVLQVILKGATLSVGIFFRSFKILITPVIESVKALQKTFMILSDSTLSPTEKLKKLKEVGVDAFKSIKDTTVETVKDQMEQFKSLGESVISIHTAFTETVKAQNVEQVESAIGKNQAIIEDEIIKNETILTGNNELTEKLKKNDTDLTTERIQNLNKVLTTTKLIEGKIFGVVNEFHNKRLADIDTLASEGALSEKQAAKAKANANRKFAIFQKAQNISQIAIDTARAVASVLPNIPLSIIMGVLGGIQEGVAIGTPIPDIPAFQRGGITRSGLSIVGERGPEIAQFPSGTQIINNRETKEILKEGGITIQNLNLPNVIDPPSFYEAMQNFQRENGIIQTEA